MTAATQLPAKVITTCSNIRLFKLDEVQDGDTIISPFGKTLAVFIQVIETATPAYVSYTVSGRTITLETSANDIDLDVMIIGE